jgi:hypothetical protein
VNLHLFYRRWRSRIGPPRVDVPLLVALLLLIAAGLAVLHSAAAEQPRLVWSQAARMGAGLLALWVISRIPPQTLRVWTPWLFAASLALLLLVPLFGTGRSGRHWLYLGLFYLQPSELLKLTVPLIVAAWLHARPLPPRWGSLAVCAALIGVPTALIAIQPDLGTALVVASSGAFVAFLGGMAWWRIGLLVSVAAAAAPLAWPFLREYHRKRFMTFLDPEADPLGAGWNIIQSKIAVGSGGLFGKGWGQGTQSRLEFLPEHTTRLHLCGAGRGVRPGRRAMRAGPVPVRGGALPVDRDAGARHLRAPVGRRHRSDLPGLRAGERRHGVGAAAGDRRADALAQLWRHLGCHLARGFRHRDERARASQADAPLRLAQMIDVMPCFRSAGLAPLKPGEPGSTTAHRRVNQFGKAIGRELPSTARASLQSCIVLPGYRACAARTTTRPRDCSATWARFQLKLLLEAARDLVLIPLSLAAACWDLALSSRQTPRFFRRVIDLGRRSDDYIDLWGKDDAGKPVENVDAVMARVERLLRDPRSGPRQARALRRWVEISLARQRRHAGIQPCEPRRLRSMRRRNSCMMRRYRSAPR